MFFIRNPSSSRPAPLEKQAPPAVVAAYNGRAHQHEMDREDNLLGSRVGHYEVRSLAGAGGMGHVYRARDTRLGRDVALKVLPPEWTADPDRLARLEREARLLAALNHPNIATIHGLEDAATLRILVLEFIEGDTLADRVARGPLPPAEALSIARQIKDALEAAHEKGVVHRDLKPANIKITPAGLVKVLDFGLATLEPAFVEAPLDHSQTPTVTARGTREGVIAGTAAYMSPEQARGLAIDKRTDIWAFGCVLYEMFVGETPFARSTLTDTLAAVVEGEPDWSALPRHTPRGVERVIRQCLEKDHKKRLRDIGDAWMLLEVDEPAPPRPSHWTTGFWRLGWIAAALGAAAAAWLWLTPAGVAQPTRITALLPPDGSEYDFVATGSFSQLPTLSPDGRRIVFGARSLDGTATQLWVRSLDSATARPLPGTEGGNFPFWSPDSRYVAFGSRADQALKKVDVQGGPPVTIAAMNTPLRGGSWSAEGIIVFGDSGSITPLTKVAETGGPLSPATAIEPGTDDTGHRFPWFLPDGRHFLYLSPHGGGRPNSVRVGSLDDATRPGKIVAEAESHAIYSQGHLLYLRGNTLMAQPFDVRALETTGEARAVADRIPTVLQPARFGHYSASATGLLVYPAPGRDALSSSLVWRDRNGNQLVAPEAVAGRIVEMQLSPDQTKLLASVTERNGNDLWIYDVASNRRTRFTFDRGAEPYAVWSRDGKTIIWRDGPGALYRKASNLTGTEQVLSSDIGQSPSSLSLDDKTLFVVKGGVDIWSLPLVPDASGNSSGPRPVLASQSGEDHPQLSPDGKWLAYTSDESGIREAYVVAYPGLGGKRQISSGGASHVRWRSDSREVFFVVRDGDLVAAEIAVRGDTLEVGRIQRLFGGVQSVDGPQGYVYDVTRDGSKFIVVESVERRSGAPQALTLVENWPGLLSTVP